MAGASTLALPRLVEATDMPFEQNGVPSLPEGLPKQLESELCWIGADFADGAGYLCTLSPAHLVEITDALKHFKSLELDGDKVSPETFPLPTLSTVLVGVSHDIHHGKGFAVIRGLNPSSYSVEDLTLVYLGLQSYVAEERGQQDHLGNILVHIVANESASKHHRHSTKPITFHNEEAGDVISWLTRSAAAAGGKCIISSAYTVYNALASTRPDLIRALCKGDWPISMPKFRCRPLMFYNTEEERLILNFGRAMLLGSAAHPRPTHLPAPSPTQIEALDAIEAIARATELQIKTQPGDVHFINNLAVLHRRDGFVDGSDAGQRRHLVRMRLRSSQHGWSIPDALERDWAAAFRKEGDKDIYHLEPMPECYLPLRQNPN